MANDIGAYSARGVSAAKEDVHKAIASHDKGLYPGAFCKITSDPFGGEDSCSLMHTDDVGTKSITAYIVYKETGDASVFRDIAVDSAVMNLDDMLCVGASGSFIFSNTIGRNAHRIGGDAVEAIIDGYSDFCKKMSRYGIEMIMCGGETSDTGDIVATVFVDSTFYTRMKRSEVIDASEIRPGDAIVGLASYGKAVYEDRYNSGIASNGLTAARHLLLSDYYTEKYPETYSSATGKEFLYNGKYRVEDPLAGAPLTVGEAILSPTRTYAPAVREMLVAHRGDIHGIIHNTGGGMVKCRNFGRGLRYIKDAPFEIPPVFGEIYASGQIDMREMYNVFNMGQRMELYCSEKTAQKLIGISLAYGVEAKIIGHVEANADESNTVVIGDYIY